MKKQEIEIRGTQEFFRFIYTEKISLENHQMFGLYLTDDFKILHFYDVGNSTEDVEIYEYSIPPQFEEELDFVFPCNDFLCPDPDDECRFGKCPKPKKIEKEKANEIIELFQKQKNFNHEKEQETFLINLIENLQFSNCKSVFRQLGSVDESCDGKKRYYTNGSKRLKIISTIVDNSTKRG